METGRRRKVWVGGGGGGLKYGDTHCEDQSLI